MLDVFKTLKEGDVFEMNSPLPGLSGEKLVAQVVKVRAESWCVELYWFGVFLCTAAAQVHKGALEFRVLGST